MKVKVCSRCKEEKVVDEFGKNKSRKDGYQSSCKECSNEYATSYRKENKEKIREIENRHREENKDKIKERRKRYREENKEKIREIENRYYEENKDKLKERRKRYYEGNKDKVKEKDKRYREANPDKLKERRKRYYEGNKDKVKEKDKRYREANQDKIKKKNKRYREANPDKIKEKRKRYHKKRIQEDELYKLKESTRGVIGCAIRRRGYTKKSRTYEILGCSYEEFKVYIESRFKDGMNWDNYGEWHLDHIIPISYGMNEVEVMALNHFSNFQPLWAEENISKGNRYIG